MTEIIEYQTPSRWRCPICGNEVSQQEAQQHPDDPVLCARCPNGEYTNMEPMHENINDED